MTTILPALDKCLSLPQYKAERTLTPVRGSEAECFIHMSEKEKLEKQNKKQAVLTATLELVCEYGLHGTSVAMIAEKADVGMGTIYRYFKTKDEIINTLYLEIKSFFVQSLLKKDNIELDIKKRFFYIWTNLVKIYTLHPKELRFLEQCANSPFLSKETVEKQKHFSEIFINLFEQGIRENIFSNIPPNILQAMLYGAALQIAKLHLQENIKLDDGLLHKAFEGCWQGIVRKQRT